MTSKVKYYYFLDGSFNKAWINENGQVHREDSPACEYSNGLRIWYKDGTYHREDGPAIVWDDGNHEYYLNNKEYFKEEYWKEIERRKKK